MESFVVNKDYLNAVKVAGLIEGAIGAFGDVFFTVSENLSQVEQIMCDGGEVASVLGVNYAHLDYVFEDLLSNKESVVDEAGAVIETSSSYVNEVVNGDLDGRASFAEDFLIGVGVVSENIQNLSEGANELIKGFNDFVGLVEDINYQPMIDYIDNEFNHSYIINTLGVLMSGLEELAVLLMDYSRSFAGEMTDGDN